MVTVDKAGTDIGSMIRVNSPHRPVPSINAASSMSRGTLVRYAVSTKMAVGSAKAVYGRINAQYVFNRDICFIRMNKGTSVL